MADTLIDTLKNKEYSELKANLEKVVDRKIMNRIQAKKDEVVAKINGVEYIPPTIEDEAASEQDNIEQPVVTDNQDTNEQGEAPSAEQDIETPAENGDKPQGD